MLCTAGSVTFTMCVRTARPFRSIRKLMITKAIYRFGPTCLVVLLGLLLNNTFEYEEVLSTHRNYHFFDSDIRVIERRKMSAAGFPWRHHIEYRYASTAGPSIWDFSRAAYNSAFWILLAGLTYWYTGPLKRSENNETSSSKRQQFRIADIFIALTLIASVLGYYSRARSRYGESKALIKAIQLKGGLVGETLFMPTIPSLIPWDYYVYLLEPWTRISSVSIDNPPQDLVDRVVQLPTLEVLRLAGSTYKLDSLAPLTERPCLRQLQIAGRELDEPTLRMISRLKTLESLHLLRTNITADGLAMLGEMPNLQCVGLIHTDVDLSTPRIDPWMKRVRALLLPRPPKGVPGKINLDNWPELVDLCVMEYDELRNEETVSLQLSNLPKLEKVSLDSLQRFDLTFEHLPKLTALKSNKYRVENRSEPNGLLSEGVWVNRVRLSDIPLLYFATLFVRDFDSMQVDSCPNFNCSVDIRGARLAPKVTNANNKGAGIPNVALPVWQNTFATTFTGFGATFAAIGESNGIRHLDLQHIPLTGKNLESISHCKSLERIDLEQGFFKIEDLHPLSELPNLREIKIGGTLLLPDIRRQLSANQEIVEAIDSSSSLSAITDILPQINSVTGQYSTVSPIRIVGHKNLQTFLSGFWQHCSEVELSDNPQLEDIVVLGETVNSLTIRNTPKIKWIIVPDKWPKRGIVADCLRLQRFGGGGIELGDEILRGIIGSKNMTALTLAHTSISPNEFKTLGELTKLQALCVSGSHVDDESIQHWKEIKQLKYLFLEGTDITDKSLAWVAKQEQLEWLSISGSVLKQASAPELQFLPRLKSLSIHGPDLSANSLHNLPSLTKLSELRIHGIRINTKLADAICKSVPAELKSLSLRDCVVDLNAITTLENGLPSGTAIAINFRKWHLEVYGALNANRKIAIDDLSRAFRYSGSSIYSTGAFEKQKSIPYFYLDESNLTESLGIGLLNPELFVDGLKGSELAK